ncbi:MAG TPA: peptidoglycan DD-metalloendopeptidase family protein [Armatimonadota bacterium]|nr:peptidoglycan DD-metalloendopeptidase family protein [Armatimonadota bacterium]
MRRLLLLALVLVSGLWLVSRSEAARPTKKQRIQALRQRLHALTQKKAVMRAELRETKKTQRRLADQLNDSYERLEEAQSALKASEQRLRVAETNVRAATRRLAEAEQRLKVQQRRFGRRIAASYMEGPVSYADVLLGARNLSDFLDRQYYVSRVTSYDAGILKELRKAQQEVARERQRLVEQRAALAAAHQENQESVARVAQQTEQREKLLQAVKRERALQEQQLSELEQDSLDIQNSLARELARRLANPGAYRNLPRWTGQLSMPCRAPITSGFGYRFHPILHYRRLHSGIDFGARVGTPVYAAASGEVFFASWRGGYGRCIIVLHGGGMSTLYGHLSRINVRAGQAVRRGQLIGAVGSTGLSTGPHLHFEVRRNGVPVNPL